MKEVVWVFGESASGKETFIKYITSAKGGGLLDQFGWKDKSIVACTESLELIGDDLDKMRDKILEKVPTLLETSDVVLIKWQFVDTQANRLLELKENLPNALHRIIFLRVSVEEVAERLPSKKLWRHYGQELIFATNELPVVMKSLDSVKSLFDIIAIDSSGSGHYDVL